MATVVEQLVLNRYVPHNRAALTSFTTSATAITPPEPNPTYLRLQPEDGDLLVEIAYGTPEDPAAGSLKIRQDSDEWIQLSPGAQVKVASTTGTVTAGPVWGYSDA